MRTPPALNPATLYQQARDLNRLAERINATTAPLLGHFLDVTGNWLSIDDDGLRAAATDGQPRTRTLASPVEALVVGYISGLERHHVTGNREDVRDALVTELPEAVQAFGHILDALEAVMIRTAGRPPVQRVPMPDPCRGLGQPCPNVPSDHRDGDGTTVAGLCDDHFAASCRTCRTKPREGRNTQCAACRKSDQRKRAAEAAA